MFASVIVASVFGILASLHVYWAAGGRLGISAAIPTVEGKALMAPSPLITLLVAGMLYLASALVLARGGLLDLGIAKWYVHKSTWVISILFAARAIGDFRYVGFFKRVRGTRFAIWDSRFFSPICVLIAVGTTAVSLT